jgi:FKBP-type peptidyl-prolyl cis-trans isomerase
MFHRLINKLLLSSKSPRRGYQHLDGAARGAIFQKLELLEERSLPTSIVAVTTADGFLALANGTGDDNLTPDRVNVTFAGQQVTVTSRNGTQLRVNGGTTDQTTFTFTTTRPLAISINLDGGAQDVQVTGVAGTALADVNVDLSGATAESLFRLNQATIKNLTITGGAAVETVTIGQLIVQGKTTIGLGGTAGDELELQQVQLKGRGTRIESTTFAANQVSFDRPAVINAKNSSFTRSNSKRAMTINTGSGGNVAFNTDAAGANEFSRRLVIRGDQNQPATVYRPAGSLNARRAPIIRSGNVQPTAFPTTVTAPTVTAINAARKPATLTGTWDSARATQLSVEVAGRTYRLGIDSELTTPTAGNWSLALANVTLPRGSTTVTVITRKDLGPESRATGTINLTVDPAELARIGQYLTANNLTSTETASGLNYVVTTAGTGPRPTTGQTLSVKYTGRLLNNDGTLGATFDSNTSSTAPFTFTLGRGQVIAGWDEAFALLNIGSKAQLLIPSNSAYGNDTSRPNIPANSTLFFDVEVLGAITAPTVINVTGTTKPATLTGTWDNVNANQLTVTLAGTTYTLGAANSPLTTPSAGNWSLNLANITVPNGTNQVTVSSRKDGGPAVEGRGTLVISANPAAESTRISQYLTRNNLTATETTTGLNYVVTTSGTGARPTAGQRVSIKYTGRVLNDDGSLGTQFGSNITPAGDPLVITLGQTGLMPGWEEGFMLLNAGTVGKLIVPAALGYGATPVPTTPANGTNVPANSTLVFDFEIVGASTPPTVTSASGTTKPATLVGTYDNVNANQLTVRLAGTTYTLGATNSPLTATGSNWSLNLANITVANGTSNVVVSSRTAGGLQLEATGTLVISANPAAESARIAQYLTLNNLTATETASGLNTITTTAGTGALPTAGQRVSVKYTGRVLNNDGTLGTPFVSNISPAGDPLAFNLGQAGLLPGWEEGFKLFGVGATGKLIVPAALGYAATPTPTVPANGTNVPANSTLVFDFEVVGLVATVPTVTSVSSATKPATLAGTWDNVNSDQLTVTLAGTTYTLGAANSPLTATAGTWSLNLANISVPTGVNQVVVNSQGPNNARAVGRGTLTITTNTGADATKITNYFRSTNQTSIETVTGLNYVVTTPGTGAIPTAGQLLSVKYTGRLINDDGTLGTQFDSNINPVRDPFTFNLGQNQVIDGWDEAFALLRVGSKAQLLIPAGLAYGSTPRTGIPANSTLYFEVELLSAATP